MTCLLENSIKTNYLTTGWETMQNVWNVCFPRANRFGQKLGVKLIVKRVKGKSGRSGLETQSSEKHLEIHKCLSFPSKLCTCFLHIHCVVFLTLFAAGLNQAVHAKIAASHIALWKRKSGIKSARELCKPLKELASLVVCNEKNFFGGEFHIFCE